MKYLLRILVPALVITLAGCAEAESPEARWMREKHQQDDLERQAEAQAQEQQNRVDEWTRRCRSYGNSANTPAMAQCVQMEALSDQRRADQANRDAQERYRQAVPGLLCGMDTAYCSK